MWLRTIHLLACARVHDLPAIRGWAHCRRGWHVFGGRRQEGFLTAAAHDLQLLGRGRDHSNWDCSLRHRGSQWDRDHLHFRPWRRLHRGLAHKALNARHALHHATWHHSAVAPHHAASEALSLELAESTLRRCQRRKRSQRSGLRPSPRRAGDHAALHAVAHMLLHRRLSMLLLLYLLLLLLHLLLQQLLLRYLLRRHLLNLLLLNDLLRRHLMQLLQLLLRRRLLQDLLRRHLLLNPRLLLSRNVRWHPVL
mmetsp:Transcript_3917/g.8071  ORF Transcript_3917/g.8071 Transcript_3917/m.8071 type:complete len:252 (+) Transcript_3917:290-1045(+)